MRRPGFTLIEILASIAIISVLVALALPAISGARDSAKRAKCLANLQGWGRAFTLYRGDYDGLLPFAEFPISLSRGFLDPLPALEGYIDHPLPRIDGAGEVQTGGPYICPGDPDAHTRGVSYAYPPYEVMILNPVRIATLQYEYQPYLPIFQDHANFHTAGVPRSGRRSIEARNVLLINGEAEKFDVDRHIFNDW